MMGYVYPVDRRQSSVGGGHEKAEKFRKIRDDIAVDQKEKDSTFVHRVSKNCAKLFFLELRQI